MIATSPRIRTRTSRASRFEIATGRAVWARKPARSTSEPSGFAAQKVLRQDLLESADVRCLDGPDVVPIELPQRVDIRVSNGLGWHGSLLRGHPDQIAVPPPLMSRSLPVMKRGPRHEPDGLYVPFSAHRSAL